MLSRVSAIRSLNTLRPTSSRVSLASRRWESSGSKTGSGDGAVASSSSSSSGSASSSPAKPYDGPVLKAWEQHPALTEYTLTNGHKNLMIDHQFVAHIPWNEGNRRYSTLWWLMMFLAVPFWIGVVYTAETKFQVRPYYWWPLGISRILAFDKDFYLQCKVNPDHYYQKYDERLEDPNAEEEEDDEDEDEDED